MPLGRLMVEPRQTRGRRAGEIIYLTVGLGINGDMELVARDREIWTDLLKDE